MLQLPAATVLDPVSIIDPFEKRPWLLTWRVTRAV